MSEHITPAGRRTGGADGYTGEQAVDRLLADSGFDDARDIRAELLELRSLASTAPPPSASVRALMIGGRAASGTGTTAEVACATAGAPTAVLTSVEGSTDLTSLDELAARRRRKRRTAIAGLAVAVSLAGGATAAAASEGGIPGAFQHLGSTIGSVVSQLTPGSGNGSGHNPGSPSEQERGRTVTPATPYPSGRNPGGNGTSGNGANPGEEPQGGTNGASGHSNSPKAPNGGTPEIPRIPGNGQPGNISIPTPAAPITPPGIEAPNVTPPTLRQSDSPVPVPTHVVPEEPVTPGNG
ncbi:hypothetical protein StoSoilA2_41750 [Arthrobacter sp. StoSoilA2]|uniref:hypothetical protein n=1 Tax=Arthrobacter sp. StoSoilA2 TaxID=2830990 RepID=UPI001CC5C536|nr:hypothetical protein [Arthrobacter sp. StoSoilA2]BCW38119.1 hypothetical protein StoSoilA2_41750 [Arthrobacter sp. StoSoilA2]